MLDWMFEKRVRVRVKFVTCWGNYYENELTTRFRILGLLASYEGSARDKMLYLRMRSVTSKFYDDCKFAYGGHKEQDKDTRLDQIDNDAWIEFNCWESTFKKIHKNKIDLCWFFYDEMIVEEVL